MAWLGLGKIQRRHVIRVLVLVALALGVATSGSAQQPAADPAKPQTQSQSQSSATSTGASPASSSSAVPQFFDPPKFTVSGVTDTTNLGGHGSDTVVRARDSIAKETATLGKTPEPTREAAEHERDRVQLLISQSPDRADLHHQLATAEETLGDSLAAVREYQRAAELDPQETYLFDWGAELLLHHAPEPALEVFTKGNRLFPKSERILLGIGAARYAQGSIDEALSNVRTASDLNPDDAAPYLFVGEMNRAETILPEAAVAMMHRFVTLHPESAEANYEYAVALWKSRPVARNESQDAALAVQEEALLDKATQIDPKFAAAYLQMGIVHADRKGFLKAIDNYQHAITVAGQAIRRGNSAVVDSSISEFADTDSVVQEAHFRLGAAYRQVGEVEKAKTEMKICSDLAAKSAQKTERERQDFRQFVYTLRDPAPPAQ